MVIVRVVGVAVLVSFLFGDELRGVCDCGRPNARYLTRKLNFEF